MVIDELVQKFRDNAKDVTASGYREHQLRVEYINPLFELMGWDVINHAGRPVALKDVIHEDAVKVEGRAKAPDYGFRTEGTRRFFVEAKSPSVGVHDPGSALQLRRYGWSAKLPISVLTDFENLLVYDCRIPPLDKDSSDKGLLLSIPCDSYSARWIELSALLSRDAVVNGSLEQFAIKTAASRGFMPVDEAFLIQIEGWRNALAQEIARKNRTVDLVDLNTAVQLIIDRIVFLRIAEDRGIEPHGKLLSLCKGGRAYERLVKVFLQADARYNSGLFHFNVAGDRSSLADGLTPGLVISNRVIEGIIRGIYRPESPYEFSVMPAELLGHVYEQFLGKVIRLTTSGAIVDDKPEVKKAGGVYYTPTDVTRYIVGMSLTPQLSAPPLQVSRKDGRKGVKSLLRVLDPACGSGSFLIEVYQQLLDWHLDWYVKDGAPKHSRGRNPKLFYAGPYGWRLSIAEKRRILLSHIYGVDIDSQAVEVTKLSLLLKLLDGESNDALAAQMDLFETRVLPDLSENIKCGNSLVGADIFPELTALFKADEEVARNNPFEWQDEFPFSDIRGAFDIIVGNPPYIDSEWMTKHWPYERKYCTERYAFASGNWDIFCAFIGKAVDLLRPNGTLSFIVPNKIMTATYAAAARKYLLDNGNVEVVRDYSAVSVFPVAVYPVVFAFKQGGAGTTSYEKVLQRTSTTVEIDDVVERQLPRGGDEWRFQGENTTSGEFESLGRLSTIFDAATVGEAYDLKDLLVDQARPHKGDLKVVNSGTIDPYVHYWGDKAMRYIKRSLLHPVLKKESQALYSDRRIQQAKTPKIMLANMTKCLEAVYDENGEFLAGKSVSVIIPTVNPWLLLSILNSKFMSKYYEERFHGRKLAGGYLQVAPAALRQVPIPATVPRVTLTRLENLCRQLIGAKTSLHLRTGHTLTVGRRAVVGLEAAIEKEVVGLYTALNAVV